MRLVEELCTRLRAPNDYRDVAVLTARLHGDCHRAHELRPGTVLRLLDSLDAFRRPQRFEQFLLACEADFRGRPGYESMAYSQAAYLRRAQAAAAAIKGADLMKEGLDGKALGEELARRRTQAIAELRDPEN
jgi:tRNA nucleotidyltransferase (CCA-adding enzyme)